jgi:hypothetical protein
MPLIQDEQLVKTLMMRRADPAFCHRIGFRRAKRRRTVSKPSETKTWSKVVVNLLSRS